MVIKGIAPDDFCAPNEEVQHEEHDEYVIPGNKKDVKMVVNFHCHSSLAASYPVTARLRPTLANLLVAASHSAVRTVESGHYFYVRFIF